MTCGIEPTGLTGIDWDSDSNMQVGVGGRNRLFIFRSHPEYE